MTSSCTALPHGSRHLDCFITCLATASGSAQRQHVLTRSAKAYAAGENRVHVHVGKAAKHANHCISTRLPWYSQCQADNATKSTHCKQQYGQATSACWRAGQKATLAHAECSKTNHPYRLRYSSRCLACCCSYNALSASCCMVLWCTMTQETQAPLQCKHEQQLRPTKKYLKGAHSTPQVCTVRWMVQHILRFQYANEAV